MKNLRSAWLVMLLLGVLVLISFPSAVSAHTPLLPIADIQRQISGQVTQTPLPVASPLPTETTLARILPPVGDNAGLVLGATVLVLIIIVGVIISSRWRVKH